jgi:plastin-1
LKLQTFASSRTGNNNAKNSSAFLKVATTTLLHTISESEKASYVTHINNYLAEDEFLKKYLPLDPSTNDLFEIAKDGVLLWYQSYIHYYIILSSYVTNYDIFFIYT